MLVIHSYVMIMLCNNALQKTFLTPRESKEKGVSIMPSPFPGMDPYLEDPAIWPEVHQSLITYIRDVLQPHLRSTNYRARINERVILLGEHKVRPIYPDVSVSLTADFIQAEISRHKSETPADKSSMTMVEADKPIIVLEPTEIVEPFLEIRLARGGALVTVIEILSPVNKTTGADMYREKQRKILIHGINLVEIDLLRDGGHVLAVSPHEIANLPGDYWVCVSRGVSLGEYEIYPISIRKRLPRVSIPLRPPDADVVLDLPSVFDLCYDNGDFAREIDYNAEPEFPLSPADAKWADALLRDKGVRG